MVATHQSTGSGFKRGTVVIWVEAKNKADTWYIELMAELQGRGPFSIDREEDGIFSLKDEAGQVVYRVGLSSGVKYQTHITLWVHPRYLRLAQPR